MLALTAHCWLLSCEERRIRCGQISIFYCDAVMPSDDVWIGHGAIVLSGVVIGRGAVVAAGAVVTSDVERYSVVAGIPAWEVKKRFNTDDISRHEDLLGRP